MTRSRVVAPAAPAREPQSDKRLRLVWVCRLPSLLKMPFLRIMSTFVALGDVFKPSRSSTCADCCIHITRVLSDAYALFVRVVPFAYSTFEALTSLMAP